MLNQKSFPNATPFRKIVFPFSSTILPPFAFNNLEDVVVIGGSIVSLFSSFEQ
ncbi:hypothetical protein [Polaribacter sp.]|uniref:hypothetical protein n=1 Tax=Polaribacter sp. TaxID=1920175 RepID=UPI0025EFB6B3|nr:hypothetical protein [Polaribacter sp.]